MHAHQQAYLSILLWAGVRDYARRLALLIFQRRATGAERAVLTVLKGFWTGWFTLDQREPLIDLEEGECGPRDNSLK
jgi:hypothetical protein